jgi:hypothetical protein
MKEDKPDKTCSMPEIEEEHIQNFIEKPEGNRSLRKPR